MNVHLEEINRLLLNDKRQDIKSFLNNLPDTTKGKIFEYFIAELYRGNGWLSEVKGNRNDKGADIVLRHPSEPTKVKIIIQAKNHKIKFEVFIYLLIIMS